MVEDDNLIVPAVQVALEFEGLPMIVASGGLAALGEIEQRGMTEHIALDLVLPDMDGVAFSDELQRGVRGTTGSWW